MTEMIGKFECNSCLNYQTNYKLSHDGWRRSIDIGDKYCALPGFCNYRPIPESPKPMDIPLGERFTNEVAECGTNCTACGSFAGNDKFPSMCVRKEFCVNKVVRSI